MFFADRDAFLDVIALDLGDSDNALWSADDLSRHLNHALADLADAAGAEASEEITADGSATVDLSALAEIRALLAVEWPVDEQPPAHIRFHMWAGQMRLLDAIPPDGDTVRLHFRKAFTVDDEGSDVAAELEELAVLGARGYAMLQQAARTVNTVNVDGWVSRRYEEQGERTISRFRESLAEWVQAREDPPSRAGQTGSWYPEP